MRGAFLFAAGGLLGVTSLAPAAVHNLMTDSAVRDVGAYTYYARGDAAGAAIIPFSKTFYPGASLHEAGSSNVNKDKFGPGASDYATDVANTAAGSIRFKYGLLTDGVISDTSRVSSWVDIEQATSPNSSGVHTGIFDILFDLGASYSLSSVDLSCTDAAGHRFDPATNAQSVYYSNTSKTSGYVDSDFTLLGSATITGSATSALTVRNDTGTDITARYVVLRLSVRVSDGFSGSYGGYLNEVTINGDVANVPETSALGLLGLGSTAFSARRRK